MGKLECSFKITEEYNWEVKTNKLTLRINEHSEHFSNEDSIKVKDFEYLKQAVLDKLESAIDYEIERLILEGAKKTN